MSRSADPEFLPRSKRCTEAVEKPLGRFRQVDLVDV
jgi:hypothetical protein